MSGSVVRLDTKGTGARPDAILNALPHPLLIVDETLTIVYVNGSAEQFFAASAPVMVGQPLNGLIPFASPLLSLIPQVLQSGLSVNEYGIELGTPRIGERTVDIQVAPVIEQPGQALVMIQERTIADKMDRQLTHRGAARSVSGMAAVLAHEIKNPLSGIRGAAQLLEQTVDEGNRGLTRLICDETDRICKLVDRMEVFTDQRPVPREAVNIHIVLEHVRQLAASGFASELRIHESYDPSLPPVLGDRDQLVQVFLNLLKNAAEAVDPGDGEILLTTAYRPGIRLAVPGSRHRVSLPLEICVIDNGPGVPEDLMPHLFDPFVTTKSTGTGLGLALVAKIVGDHGGVIECDSMPGKTIFRILMPVHPGGSRVVDQVGSKTLSGHPENTDPKGS